jgi:hypothetical protein
MSNVVKRGGLAILGMVAVLAYWSLRGDSSSKASEGIPSQVWGGGGATLAIDVETTSPARFSVTFNERGKQDPRMLETWTKVPAGTHSWTIDVPSGVGGYIELGAETPQIGDRLRFGIRVNDRVVSEQADTLHEALQAGYAFFVQAHFEDYSTATMGDGD